MIGQNVVEVLFEPCNLPLEGRILLREMECEQNALRMISVAQIQRLTIYRVRYGLEKRESA